MEDILLLLQFNPQIPFGHLLFTAAWLLVSLCLLLFVLRSIRSEGLASRKTGLGTIALLVSAPVLYANLTIPDAIDFDPAFSKSDLVGTWTDDVSRIQLDESGNAIFELAPGLQNHSGIESGEGTWKKVSSFNFLLSNKLPFSGKMLLRVIRHRRELRLIIEDNDTPMLWDGELGFRKQ